MHKKFLEFFVDPQTGESLKLKIKKQDHDNIIEGSLYSKTNTFSIINGIPRFVDHEKDNYSSSFAFEWKKFSKIQFETCNKEKPMEGHTKKMWEIITQFGGTLDNCLILDMGCGSGRFIEIARMYGATVIGIDYSSAVEVAMENFKDDPFVCICQANALKLPFENNIFDGAYSIGVLHHTPDPLQGVQEAYRVLSNNSWFAMSVYFKNSQYNAVVTHVWRKIFNSLSGLFGYRPAMIYSYAVVYLLRPFNKIRLLRIALRFVLPNIYLKSIKWSLLDTFDLVTPAYQSGHMPYELFQWFKKIGFKQIEPSNWGLTSIKGIKKNE